MFDDFFSNSTGYYGNSLFQWALFIGIILISLVAGKIISWFINSFIKRIVKKTKTNLDDIFLQAIHYPLVVALLTIFIRGSFSILTLPKIVLTIVQDVYLLSIIFCIAWFANRLFNSFVIFYLTPIVQKSQTDLDDLLLPFLQKSISFVLWLLALMVWLHNVGYDVSAVLASLGIGGLAIALAAKDTLSNLIAAFTIFIDRPFVVGNVITVNGRDAIVKEIGMRSTRLEILFSQQLLIVPNTDLVNSQVINISAEPSHLFMFHFALAFDTSIDHVKKAINIVKQEISKHQYTEDRADAWFNLATSTKDIHARIWIKPEVFQTSNYDAVLSEVSLSILANFERESIHIAVPSQQILAHLENPK
jgi:MscS family membrane protein